MRLSELIKQKSIRNANNEIENIYSISNKEGFLLQSEQFKDRMVASDDTSNYKIVEKDYFAYNPARINVGSIARMKEEGHGIISPMYICFTCDEKILPDYLEYFYESSIFNYEMNKRLEGSVRMCLSYESMINIPIALPNIEEQEKYAQILNRMDEKIKKEELIYKNQKKLKNGLLQQMFI
jgi:type I restriction enzyme S subunit